MRATQLGVLAIAASGMFVLSGMVSAATLELTEQSFAISQSLNANQASPNSTVIVSRTLTFDKFDPSLGTLTGVRIGLRSVVDLRAGVTARSSSSSDGVGADGEFDVTLRLDADGIGTLFSFGDSLAPWCSIGVGIAGCEDDVVDLHQGFNRSYFTSDATILDNFIWSSAFPTFDVSPIADLALSITVCSGGSVPAICTAWGDLLWGADSIGDTSFPMVGVTYEYTIGVPEPGTLALLGIGLVGLGLARRRRHR